MAVVSAPGVMSMEISNGTHPFFQNQPIPHRAVKLPEIGDKGETSSHLAKSNHSNPRKRTSGPLVERPSNTHLPQLTTDDSSADAKSAASLVVESNMDKTPKKKVLKLNSNGKLLSSPPIVPVGLPTAEEELTTTSNGTSKRIKGRSPKSRASSLIAKIGYGRGESDERLKLGGTISKVLGSTQKVGSVRHASTASKRRTPRKSTHPIFSGNLKYLSGTDEDGCSKGKYQDSDASVSAANGASKQRSPHAKPAWKDIVFSSNRKLNQSNEASPAPWPPTGMQRVDDLQYDRNLHLHVTSSPLQTYKSKGLPTQLSREEDILYRASSVYSESLQGPSLSAVRHPARNVLSGEEMSSRLQEKLLFDRVHLATQRLKLSLTTTMTAFDQGKCDQSSWTVKSSPLRAEEVLQSGPEAIVLRDWVNNLTVTSVEGGPPADRTKANKPQIRKRGRPKHSDDADDFILSSEDEADELTEIDKSPRESSPFVDRVKRSVLRAGAMTSSHDKGQTKNAILVSGPTGCGKTASVYAIARELGFEVFEIHPGTRRGAKEILERVGDMTQNHMVQQKSGENAAEELPATPIDENAVQNEIASGKQRTMNGFFQTQFKTASKVGRKRKAVRQDDMKEESTTKKPKKAQKQSLILLEEVDVLFEEDKSFWAGVMSLIQQSKRPIILTCNDESPLPLDELPLHGILRYSPPPEAMATDYLLTLAASEGHELDRGAVSHLYRQRHDLRATITELDFWCQMGIGSRKGGLDWMLDRRHSFPKAGPDSMRQRVFSTNTYLPEMGLIQQQPEMDPEQVVLDAYQQLDIPIDTWCADRDRTFANSTTIAGASYYAHLYSDLDLCQHPRFDDDPSNLQLLIRASLTTRLTPTPPTPTSILDALISPPQQPPKLTQPRLLQIFSPLTNKKATFPPSKGRLAPSLDAPLSTLTTDLAPYIRSIVAVEQKRGASMPVPRRTTRATARLEGHFPEKTNPKHVLMTGGDGWQDLSLTADEER